MGVYYMLKLMRRGPVAQADAHGTALKHPELHNRALDALQGE